MTRPLAANGTASFLGVRFDLLDMPAAVRTVLALAAPSPFTYIVTPNVDHVVRLHRERENLALWSAYEHATLCLCDSQVLRALAALSGLGLTLVPGSDLTARILEAAADVNGIAVIGGDERVIDQLRAHYPALTWFHHEPPHGVLHNASAQQAVVEFVESCPATLIFLAIGSPQSELLCAAIRDRNRAQGVG